MMDGAAARQTSRKCKMTVIITQIVKEVVVHERIYSCFCFLLVELAINWNIGHSE